jgi:hypothetical protein
VAMAEKFVAAIIVRGEIIKIIIKLSAKLLNSML